MLPLLGTADMKCRKGVHEFSDATSFYCDCGMTPRSEHKPGNTWFDESPLFRSSGGDSDEKIIKLLEEIRDLLKGGRL